MNRLITLALIICAQTVAAQGITFNCSEVTLCLPLNSCTGVAATVVASATTICGSQNLAFTYKVDFGNNGSIDIQGSGDSVIQTFPTGNNRIIWRATSDCGHAATCDQIVLVKDCSGPNLICRNGITQSLDANCSMVVNAQQFVLSLSDNCTPANQIKLGLRKAGTGTGFPPFDTIHYGLCDNGTNIVEMWVRDQAGNTNQCSNYVLVQDNSNQCPCISSTDIRLKGCNRSATSTKLNSFRIVAKAKGVGGAAGITPVNTTKFNNFTDSCYTHDINGLPINFTGDVVVSASRNDLVTNGVTAYDLILISRHILNLEPMTNIYQVLAADVNRSQTVTTFDIVEIRKTLLGTLDTLPKVDAWEFIRPLADPSQMLNYAAVKDTFRLQFNAASGAKIFEGLNFIGIKSGDLDYTAALMGDPLEDRSGPTWLLGAPDQWLEAGTETTVDIAPTDAATVSAWQLRLQAKPELATIEGVTGLSPDAYALQPDGSLRMLWMDEQIGQNQYFAQGASMATVRVRAHRAGWLSEMLTTTPNSPTEAITDAVLVRPTAFHFYRSGTAPAQVFAPLPNPATDGVLWPLWLEQPGTVRLEVTDMAGRVVHSQSVVMEAGYQQLGAQAGTWASGLYAWRVVAHGQVLAGKLIVD